jgi:hypothetical protein
VDAVKRSAIATLAIAVLVPGVSRGASEDLREQSEKVVEAQGVSGVTVENARGLIRLRPSQDGRIHLTALKIVRYENHDRAVKVARETQVVTSTEGGQFVVRVRYPQRQELQVGLLEMFSGFEFPKIEVRIGIDVPAALAARLKSTSGDLETENMVGAQALETTSGDITVDGAKGPLEVSSTSGDVEGNGFAAVQIHTVSGDVELEDVGGVARINTTSGDVVLRGAADSVSFSSVSGDLRVDAAPRGITARSVSGEITARGVAGSFRLETTSGGVVVDAQRDLRRGEVTTGSGDIELTLPAGLGASLEMRTSNGTLDTSVPLAVKNVSRHVMTGVIGRGGVPLILRSSSGDINVKRGGE